MVEIKTVCRIQQLARFFVSVSLVRTVLEMGEETKEGHTYPDT